MKTFLSKIFVFTLIPVVTVIILFIIFWFAINSRIKEFRVEDNIEVVFIGDSHVRSAICDSLFVNSLNLAESSESYYFSYYKLKLLLNSNENIKTVYLGFSYNSLSEYYDEFIYGRYSENIAPQYFFILPLREQLKQIKCNFRNLPVFSKYVLTSYFKNFSRKYTFTGGFVNKHTDVAAVKEHMDGRLYTQYYSDDAICPFSSINIIYLEKIIQLCNEYNIELILLNTPLHSYYRAQVPLEFVDKYNSVLNSIDLKVIDFDFLELEDNCFAPDGDHVSFEGSIITTEALVKCK